MELSNIKEKYYLTAISNLYKRINFLELLQSKDTGQISDGDFTEEMESNFEKYSIEIRDISDSDDLSAILDIAVKIFRKIGMGDDISTSDMAELFSLKSEVFDVQGRESSEEDNV